MTGNSSKSFEKFLTTTTYKKSAQTTRHSMRASNYLPVNGDFFTKINGNAVGWIKSIKFTHSIFHNGRSKNVWLMLKSTPLVLRFFSVYCHTEIKSFKKLFFVNLHFLKTPNNCNLDLHIFRKRQKNKKR